MWLVLCDPEDQAALWAYSGLRKRGLAPIELVAPQALTRSARSAHRVDHDRAGFEIGLPDGRTLASGDIDGVLNRLSYAPVDHILFASPDDTSYAREEVSALLLSWLRCIAPVMVNRPSPRGLSGAWRSAAEWTVLAAGAGLPVSPLSLSSTPRADVDLRSPRDPCHTPRATPAHTVVVLGERVFGGERVPDLVPACGRLARLAGVDLLGIDLDLRDRGEPRFAGATPLPDLRLAGVTLLQSLHEYLTRLPARPR